MSLSNVASKTVCIVGGVAGGASTAARLRRLDERARIMLFDKGEFVSFANCGLPYFVGNVIKEEKDLIIASPALFKNRFNIEVHLQQEVTQIKRDTKQIVIKDLKSGESREQGYDYLVLSPGASPIRPNLPGLNLPGIFTLRTIPDSKHIKDYIDQKGVKSAVVIGGGFIGLEMIENLHARGLKITVLEKMPQLMPAIDFEMATPVRYELEKQGVKVLLDEGVSGFEKTDKGLRVLTDKGNGLETELVLLSIGVAPDTAIAKAAGLKMGPRDVIDVNSTMQTSDPNIYAVGDAVQVQHLISRQPANIPLAGPANRQGRIAAENIAGLKREFRGVQGTAVCGVFGLTIAMTGATTRQLTMMGHKNFDSVRVHPNNHSSYYPGARPMHLKVIYDTVSGKILGAQAVGEEGVERRIDVIATAIQLGGTVEDLSEVELCYAPQYGAAKDPVNMAGFVASNAHRDLTPLYDWPSFLSFTKESGESKTRPLLLDVRRPAEYARHHIPGTINIEVDTLRENIDKLREMTKISDSEQRPIICLCQVGQRSYFAVRLLRQYGLDARLLSGGVLTYDMLNPNPEMYDLTSNKPAHPSSSRL